MQCFLQKCSYMLLFVFLTESAPSLVSSANITQTVYRDTSATDRAEVYVDSLDNSTSLNNSDELLYYPPFLRQASNLPSHNLEAQLIVDSKIKVNDDTEQQLSANIFESNKSSRNKTEKNIRLLDKKVANILKHFVQLLYETVKNQKTNISDLNVSVTENSTEQFNIIKSWKSNKTENVYPYNVSPRNATVNADKRTGHLGVMDELTALNIMEKSYKQGESQVSRASSENVLSTEEDTKTLDFTGNLSSGINFNRKENFINVTNNEKSIRDETGSNLLSRHKSTTHIKRNRFAGSDQSDEVEVQNNVLAVGERGSDERVGGSVEAALLRHRGVNNTVPSTRHADHGHKDEDEEEEDDSVSSDKYLFIVTLPSFLGMLIVVIVCCICMRGTSLCCRVFEPQQSQVALIEDDFQNTGDRSQSVAPVEYGPRRSTRRSRI